MKIIGIFSKLSSIIFPVILTAIQLIIFVYNAYLAIPDFTDPKYYKGKLVRKLNSLENFFRKTRHYKSVYNSMVPQKVLLLFHFNLMYFYE